MAEDNLPATDPSELGSAKRGPMELYAKRVARDSAIALRRSLDRRLGGPMIWRYLQVVPSVFPLQGQFAAYELLVSVDEALHRLGALPLFTLDTASELLGQFRFGRGRHLYAYFETVRDLDAIMPDSIGQPLSGNMGSLLLALHDQPMLFTVVCRKRLPHRMINGRRVVTRDRLIRDLLGQYGLRRELLVEIENKLPLD